MTQTQLSFGRSFGKSPPRNQTKYGFIFPKIAERAYAARDCQSNERARKREKKTTKIAIHFRIRLLIWHKQTKTKWKTINKNGKVFAEQIFALINGLWKALRKQACLNFLFFFFSLPQCYYLLSVVKERKRRRRGRRKKNCCACLLIISSVRNLYSSTRTIMPFIWMGKKKTCMCAGWQRRERERQEEKKRNVYRKAFGRSSSCGRLLLGPTDFRETISAFSTHTHTHTKSR